MNKSWTDSRHGFSWLFGLDAWEMEEDLRTWLEEGPGEPAEPRTRSPRRTRGIRSTFVWWKNRLRPLIDVLISWSHVYFNLLDAHAASHAMLGKFHSPCYSSNSWIFHAYIAIQNISKYMYCRPRNASSAVLSFFAPCCFPPSRKKINDQLRPEDLSQWPLQPHSRGSDLLETDAFLYTVVSTVSLSCTIISLYPCNAQRRR